MRSLASLILLSLSTAACVTTDAEPFEPTARPAWPCGSTATTAEGDVTRRTGYRYDDENRIVWSRELITEMTGNNDIVVRENVYDGEIIVEEDVLAQHRREHWSRSVVDGRVVGVHHTETWAGGTSSSDEVWSYDSQGRVVKREITLTSGTVWTDDISYVNDERTERKQRGTFVYTERYVGEPWSMFERVLPDGHTTREHRTFDVNGHVRVQWEVDAASGVQAWREQTDRRADGAPMHVTRTRPDGYLESQTEFTTECSPSP